MWALRFFSASSRGSGLPSSSRNIQAGVWLCQQRLWPTTFMSWLLGEIDDPVRRVEAELARLRLQGLGLELVLAGDAIELLCDEVRHRGVVELPGHDRRPDEESAVHGVSQRGGRLIVGGRQTGPEGQDGGQGQEQEGDQEPAHGAPPWEDFTRRWGRW